jgi:hypothetical protein
MGYSYEGWEGGWQTWYTNLFIEQTPSSYHLVRTLGDIALRKQQKTGEPQVKKLAVELARLFQRHRNRVKKEWDEAEADALQSRGDFEARQIEGKKPPTTGDRNMDIVNEAMDLIQADMGSPSPQTWSEPDWIEIAANWIDIARQDQEAEQEEEGIVPGQEQGLPPDINEGLKAMGIKGSKEASMAVATKVEFTLKGKRFVSSLASAGAARRFVKAANGKWGKEFKIGGMGTDQEAEPVTSGINVLDAAVKPEHLEDSKMANTDKTSGFNFFFPGQALREFYPEIQHETVDFPNATNSPMGPDISGDPHEMGGDAPGGPDFITAAFDRTLDGATKLGYISTSPGAVGLGRDFKPQTLEGDSFRKEDEIRGGMFDEEFHQNYDMGPGGDALSHLAKQAGLGNAKEQFGAFLKRVMAEIAATFIAAFKVTSRTPLDKVPGIGELQLDQVEQQQYQGLSSLTLNVTGSRVKNLVQKLTDSDIQECVNDAWAQAAVWCSSQGGGFVYEVFVRAETIDSESLLLKYKFVTGTRDSTV